MRDYHNPTDPDDTLSIQRALLDLYQNYGGWGVAPPDPDAPVLIPFKYVLYFPAGTYVINEPIKLGGSFSGIHIAGDNAVVRPSAGGHFEDTDPQSPTFGTKYFAFEHELCYNVKMEGMNFIGFEKAVRIFKDNRIDSGRVEITNCGFYSNDLVALELNYASGIAELSNCKFMENGIALDILAGDKITVQHCWISYKGGMTGIHPAPIHNYARLKMSDCMLIPAEMEANCIEPAWINNYGSVEIYNTRQSGESGSCTLVNNYAGVGNDALISGGLEPSAVIVRDCQCYGAFGVVFNGSNVAYTPPAVVRFVEKIPSQVIIENNRGFTFTKIMEFSVHEYGNNTTAINNMIENSAYGLPSTVAPWSVAIKVKDNLCVFTHPNGSHIPSELWRFVRDENSLWPHQPTLQLQLLDHTTDSVTGAQVFKFEYPASFEDPLLLSFTGNPNSGGWAGYRGQLIGIIKANGSWPGTLAYALNFKELFNVNTDGNDPPFTVETVWESSGTRYQGPAVTNRNFLIKIKGSDGSWDQMKLTSLNAMMV